MIGVITTIQEPTRQVKEFAKIFDKLIVVGDVKSPKEYNVPNVEYIDIETLRELELHTAADTPCNSYSLKNVGYLLAMANNDVIYETDDDNLPKEDFCLRDKNCLSSSIKGSGFVNVYNYFNSTDIPVWPRGFPLTEIFNEHPLRDTDRRMVLIHQGLADLDPDVDAIYRLVTKKDKFVFNNGLPIFLANKQWCPFNSQNTWWYKNAFPLMYLPSYCKFRMTDIYRSFVAQRCVWEIDNGVVFYPPDVEQERNEHDLMSDFENEVDGYLKNKEICERLENLSLNGTITENMEKCYKEIIDVGVIDKKEINLLYSWFIDLETVL
jgi:hypothetical protein